MNNLGSGTVDARNNWWGDATGPTGPNGDGVSGAVNYVPFRTSPVPQPANSMRYRNISAHTAIL